MELTPTLEKFSTNEMVIDAVLFNLEQIGEIARSVSLQVTDKYSDIPWFEFVGLRNIISHNYQGVQLDIIYQIASIDIPRLASMIETKTSR